MPLHRITKGADPAADLQRAIHNLEQDGQAVVRFEDHGTEWLILTRPPKQRHAWETRAGAQVRY